MFLLFSIIPSAVLKHTVKKKVLKTFQEETWWLAGQKQGRAYLSFGSMELWERRLREHCTEEGAFEVPFSPRGGKRRVRKYCYILVAIFRDKHSKDSSIHIQHSCLPRKLKRNMPVTFASIQKISVVQTYKTLNQKNNTRTIFHTTKLAKPSLCGLRTQFPSNNLLAEFILMNEMNAKKKLLSASAR